MTTTIGGVTVADPKAGHDGVEIQDVDAAALLELADGSHVIDHVNSKERFTVRWVGLTAAELTTLEGALTRGTNLELVLPHTGDETPSHRHVFIVPSTLKKSYELSGTTAELWKVDVQFIEVS